MPMILPTLLKRILIGYLIVTLCMVSLLSAHVHLSENHTGLDVHAHATEIHVAHFKSGHDSFDEQAPHTTDATAVDINDEVSSTGGGYKSLDIVAIALIVLFLRVIPFRTEHQVPARTTPHRSDPHYSPLQVRAPPR